MFLSPDSRILYCNLRDNFTADVLMTIDTTTNTILANSPLPGPQPALPGMAVSADGKTLYFDSYSADDFALYGIDATPKGGTFMNNPKVVRIPIPNPYSAYKDTTWWLGDVAISADGRFAYVTNGAGQGFVEVIDLVTKTTVASIPLGPTGGSGSPYAFVVVPAQKPVTVGITPQTVSLWPLETQKFTASVANDINTAVTWSRDPVGTMSSDGTYTAPRVVTSPQTVTITAMSTDPTKRVTATVTLAPPAVAINAGGILNAASMTGEWIAPGEITLTGVGFGPLQPAVAGPDNKGLLPTVLAGVQVLFDQCQDLCSARPMARHVHWRRTRSAGEISPRCRSNIRGSGPTPWRSRLQQLRLASSPWMVPASGRQYSLNQDRDTEHGCDSRGAGSTIVFSATGTGVTNPPGSMGRSQEARQSQR